MVNNEFHIIGIATSNYQDISNGTFVSHLFKIEVEKFGSKAGKTFELEAQVYGTNKAVDTKKEILGRTIALNGYLDSYTTKEGSTIVKMVAQNVMVLDKPVAETKRVKATAVEPEVVPSVDDEDDDIQSEDSLDGISIPDDDLPF